MSKVFLCDRHNTFALFSQDAFFEAGAAVWDASIFMKSGRRGTLDVSCCAFFANRNVGAASSGHSVQIAWQASQFVTCDEN